MSLLSYLSSSRDGDDRINRFAVSAISQVYDIGFALMIIFALMAGAALMEIWIWGPSWV
jgi:hypothetical protein